MTKPITHHKLNAKQLYILKQIYKFRFTTAPLLAKYKGLKSRHSMYMTLEKLKDQDYLAKRIDVNDVFRNKGGRYYLTLKTLKLLRDEHGFNKRVLLTMRNNSSVTEKFIDSQIDIFKVSLALRNSYPNTFDLFTKTELGDYDYFPSPPPDLYINRLNRKEGIENEYLLDVIGDNQLFVTIKRIKQYIEHYESGDWEATTKSEYPTVLLICPSGKIEQRIQEEISKILTNMGMDDEIFFYTTTLKAVLNSNVNNRKVWSDVFEPEKLIYI